MFTPAVPAIPACSCAGAQCCMALQAPSLIHCCAPPQVLFQHLFRLSYICCQREGPHCCSFAGAHLTSSSLRRSPPPALAPAVAPHPAYHSHAQPAPHVSHTVISQPADQSPYQAAGHVHTQLESSEQLGTSSLRALAPSRYCHAKRSQAAALLAYKCHNMPIHLRIELEGDSRCPQRPPHR